MTQIKLLVIMPAPEDQQDDDTSRDATFTGEVNAILRFDGGWRLTMSGTDYPGATAESTEMAGDADDPPVKEAITSLAQAAAAEPEPDEDAAGDGDAEGITVNTQAEVLQFEVPEGSDTVQVRVEPEVFVRDGEPHVRVKVNDPAWVKDTSSAEAKDTGSSETEDTGSSG